MKKVILGTLGATLLSISTIASADHRWADYHWATLGNGLNLPVIDSVTPDWQTSYTESLSQWEQGTPIVHTEISADDGKRTRKRCKAESGKMRVCNDSYGYNGWAGLASINLDSNGHIVQGVAKMNDSYLATSSTAYRNHVMCQEIGHVYGLGHTSEDGSSQQTCMDYSNDNNSQWPNSHDRQLLTEMYSHNDGYETADAGGSEEPCRGGPKKCGSQFNGGLGIKVWQKGRAQIRVSQGPDGTIWVHHITLAEGHDDIVHDPEH
ncbi:hypothetical protein [Kangiella sediminilitoris]|uniref:Serine protease n=1 Tax=Kangiella sediminilitoris TaxID=1144748 RepID=A0A1B3B7T4_9GAMM|nr:hypothetical protein [Kangiella sediminilitoris]AOE48852.1 Serine protease [Kangiella sediminilitoris]